MKKKPCRFGMAVIACVAACRADAAGTEQELVPRQDTGSVVANGNPSSVTRSEGGDNRCGTLLFFWLSQPPARPHL